MNKKIALVIPTIREHEIKKFLETWRDQIAESETHVYIVEDNREKTFNLKNVFDLYEGNNIEHLCHSDAPESVLDSINLKSPCCRQIGFWKAYYDGFEIIITLDDDVRPIDGSNIFLEYYEILINGVPLWVDPLLNYRSRGYPIRNVGRVAVSFHVGSFMGVPDVDGKTQLQYENRFITDPPKYIPRATIVPRGQLIPVNGGICGWKREVTPFIHYTVWDERLGYRRFDDIWMGVILKSIFDYTGIRMSYGQTFVNHIRASDANKNIEYEKNGIEWNEEFWEILDSRIKQNIDGLQQSPTTVYLAIAKSLKDIDNSWAHKEGECMEKWINNFTNS